MTHYNVSYEGMSGERKRKQALLDCRAYLGKERFAKVRRLMRQTKVESSEAFDAMDYWYHALAFAGIQGYPVRALVLSYAPNGKEIAS